MMVLGQPLQTPFSRTWATPPETSSTSIRPPSSSSAGPTCSASARDTRALRSSCGDMIASPSDAGQPAGLVHVAAQLGHEFVNAAKRPRVAQPGDELDHQRLAVEVPFKADQVDLDLARLFPE